MNRQLLEILFERTDVSIGNEDKRVLEFFVDYLDHNSLWLLGFEPAADPVFLFTNDAQRYRFSMSEINRLYADLKRGIPMDWERIPFEYISKP